MTDDELKKLDFGAWPLPDAYLIEIGRVAALWATLESFLNICLGKLAGFDDANDPKPFILVYHSSFPQKLDMFGSLCEHLLPNYPDLADYSSVVGALRSAQKLRNAFLHHGLVADPQTGKVQMAKGSARGTLSFKVQNISLEDIRRAAVAINEAHRALYKLVFKREIPAPWAKL
jgi:hypothetical protein